MGAVEAQNLLSSCEWFAIRRVFAAAPGAGELRGQCKKCSFAGKLLVAEGEMPLQEIDVFLE
jgi:hypothetical protein